MVTKEKKNRKNMIWWMIPLYDISSWPAHAESRRGLLTPLDSGRLGGLHIKEAQRLVSSDPHAHTQTCAADTRVGGKVIKGKMVWLFFYLFDEVKFSQMPRSTCFILYLICFLCLLLRCTGALALYVCRSFFAQHCLTPSELSLR